MKRSHNHHYRQLLFVERIRVHHACVKKGELQAASLWGGKDAEACALGWLDLLLPVRIRYICRQTQTVTLVRPMTSTHVTPH